MKDHYHIARKRMVEEQLIGGGVSDKRVLEAMGDVPRHRFVETGLEDQAYLDRPLTIGQGQTISQPLIVGLMTQALQLKGTEKVLEIGTGSGYQTAVLSQLAKEVYSVERLSELSLRARKISYRLGFKNIQLRVGDGTLGWPEQAPFDAIIVTAASPEFPNPLKDQLADGGRLVIPIGNEENQKLFLIQRKNDHVETSIITECRFVKLVGQYGWKT